MSRILLIDDDQTLRRALRLTMEKVGYEVVEAGDGNRGLTALKEHRIDLVVTDIIMPGMEGLETIRELRKVSAVLPIIAITGGGQGSADSYLYIAEQFGAAAIFAKPFEFGELCRAVAVLLKGEAPTITA